MKKLFYSLLFLFAINTSFATHNMAGDISYTYVGTAGNPYRYKIIVQTYTKWIGTSGTDRCELMIYFGDSDSALIPRVNGPSVNCPATADGLLIGGCTGNIRYNVYEATHDFAGPGNYIITMQDPARASGICNIPLSDNTTFTLQAELIINPFLGNNSSPAYNQIPILCDTSNIIAYYNPLAIDSDGDSLYYELITPLTNGGFVSGYILPNASNSFTINSITGLVTWDKPMWICPYVFAIRITEWRNVAGSYFLIGRSIQEIYSIVTPYMGISDENTSSTSLNIFPNPSNGLINMTIEGALQNQEYQIVISNSMGQIIKTIDISNSSAVINENELSSGIYFYALSNKAEILNKGKFVILDGNVK